MGLGLVLRASGRQPRRLPDLTLSNAVVENLIPVTIGNVIGGSVMVGLVYWLIYIRARR